MENGEILDDLIGFFSVAIIFLVVIALVFAIFCRKFKFNNIFNKYLLYRIIYL